ncbi:MAG: PH domain-containing protein [Pyrinomonadaceae bacterium]
MAESGFTGTSVENEKTESDPADGISEMIFSVSPTVKFVLAGYAAAVIAAFALVVILTIFIPGLAPAIGAVAGVLIILIPAYFHLKRKLVRYTLTDSTIEIDRGLISRTTQNIPLRRIQDVTVSAGILQRILGYGDISIDNASEDGGKVVLKSIDSPKKYADLILRQLRRIDR